MKISGIAGLVIAFLVIGVIIGVGLLISSEISDDFSTTSTQLNNETIALTSGARTYLVGNESSTTYRCFSNPSILNVSFENLTVDVGSGNYTLGDLGYIEGTAGWAYNGTNINVTYSFLYSPTEACIGVEGVEEYTTDIPTWFGILVIVFIAGIILYIIFAKIVPATSGGGSGSFDGFRGFGRRSGVAEI